MPRSSSKSQASKGRHLSSVPVTPVPAQEPEIIPGRLTQTQWTSIVSQEESDDIVGEIVDSMLSTVNENCLTVYITQQAIPFTIAWAKEQFITTLEQQIVCPDEGEEPEVSSATEDAEPSPTAPDSWVEGYGPVLSITQLPGTTIVQQETDVVQIPVSMGPKVDQFSHSKSPRKHPEGDLRPLLPVCHQKSFPVPPRKVHPIIKKRADLPHMPVPIKLPAVQSIAVMKKQVEEEDRGLYVIYNNMAGPYVHSKGYQAIPRLKPSCLPKHSIFPQYEIVSKHKDDGDDGGDAKPDRKKPRGGSKHEQIITRLMPPTISGKQPPMFQRRDEANVFLKKLSPTTLRQQFTQSLNLDSKILANGFPSRDRPTDRNPLTFSTPTPLSKLRILQNDMDVPQFSINQANVLRSPEATPMFLTKD